MLAVGRGPTSVTWPEPGQTAAVLPFWPTFGSDGDVPAGLEAADNQDEDNPALAYFRLLPSEIQLPRSNCLGAIA